MSRTRASVWLIAALAVVATMVAACGGTTGGGTTNKGTIIVGGFKFPESSILAQIYGEALAHDAYTVTYKLNLGTREVVAPALKNGDTWISWCWSGDIFQANLNSKYKDLKLVFAKEGAMFWTDSMCIPVGVEKARCLAGEMQSSPIGTPRILEISSETFAAGSTPPWPGLAPWLILSSTILI